MVLGQFSLSLGAYNFAQIHTNKHTACQQTYVHLTVKKEQKMVKLQLQADRLDKCAINSSIQRAMPSRQMPFQRMCARTPNTAIIYAHETIRERTRDGISRRKMARKAMHLPSSSSSVPFAQSCLACISIASRTHSHTDPTAQGRAAGKTRLTIRKCVYVLYFSRRFILNIIIHILSNFCGGKCFFFSSFYLYAKPDTVR